MFFVHEQQAKTLTRQISWVINIILGRSQNISIRHDPGSSAEGCRGRHWCESRRGGHQLWWIKAVELVLLSAPQKIRGRSAQDPAEAVVGKHTMGRRVLWARQLHLELKKLMKTVLNIAVL